MKDYKITRTVTFMAKCDKCKTTFFDYNNGKSELKARQDLIRRIKRHVERCSGPVGNAWR